MIASLLLVSLVGTGSVHLTLTDAHNKPLVHREVWLDSTNSTKNVRPFGDFWFIPNAQKMTGVTDGNGKVTIDRIPTGEPYMVITRLGSRFGENMDVMKLEGAVYVGKPAHIIVADDYKIVGAVTQFETGAPLEGVSIELDDTGFGQMGGYPLTRLDSTKTDSHGRYVFDRLPNCSYTVMMRDVSPGMGVESRVENGAWEFLQISGEDGEFGGSSERSMRLVKSEASYDFRQSRAAKLKLIIRKGSLKTMRGWTVSLRTEADGSSKGVLLDYENLNVPAAPPKDIQIVTWPVMHGNHSIIFTRDSDDASFVVKKLDFKAGDKMTFDFTLSQIAQMEREK
jgi:hypothetical protein